MVSMEVSQSSMVPRWALEAALSLGSVASLRSTGAGQFPLTSHWEAWWQPLGCAHTVVVGADWRNYIFVLLDTDDGLTGLGEAARRYSVFYQPTGDGHLSALHRRNRLRHSESSRP